MIRGLPTLRPGAATRVRRWDALILGSALPGLVAGVALAMRGARVLVLEEAGGRGARRPPRDPFLLTGAHREAVLGACLRALGIRLIDRRLLRPDPLALQVVLPDARIDTGDAEATAREWVTWGLAGPDAAQALTHDLCEAAAAERAALLGLPPLGVSRRGRILRRLATSTRPLAGHGGAQDPPGAPRRGVAELPEGSPRLAAVLAAQARALSNLGETAPTPEARARLLGAPLEGAVSIPAGAGSLDEILRRRLASLHGEFRTLQPGFRLVVTNGQPGVALAATSDVYVGRVFLVNATPQALAAALEAQPLPGLLRGPAARRRRVTVHFQVDRGVYPEGMGRRVVWIGDPDLPADGTNVVSLVTRESADGGDLLELAASSVVAASQAEAPEPAGEIEEAVRRLLPFCGDRVRRCPGSGRRWDHDELLAEPARGASWPSWPDLPSAKREPVYLLDRSAVAGLGGDGDLMLGWRAGAAIARELA